MGKTTEFDDFYTKKVELFCLFVNVCCIPTFFFFLCVYVMSIPTLVLIFFPLVTAATLMLNLVVFTDFAVCCENNIDDGCICTTNIAGAKEKGRNKSKERRGGKRTFFFGIAFTRRERGEKAALNETRS